MALVAECPFHKADFCANRLRAVPVSLLSQRHGGDHRKRQREAGGVGTMAATSGVSLPIEEAGWARSQVL